MPSCDTRFNLCYVILELGYQVCTWFGIGTGLGQDVHFFFFIYKMIVFLGAHGGAMIDKIIQSHC